MIDVISIKKAVKKNELQFYVKNGNILCRADNGDCVKVGETYDEAENTKLKAEIARLKDEALWDKHPEPGY